MQCPVCLNRDARHIKTTHYVDAVGDEYTVRRRECRHCNHRFTTYECYEKADVELIFKMREAEAHLLKGELAEVAKLLINAE